MKSNLMARYDLYENPSVEGKDGQRSLHARVVTDGTISTKQIAEKIGFASSLTAGDIKALLSALSHYVGEMLGEGRRVHIEGLGYFQMTLKCPPAKHASEVRGENVEFKAVSFRAEQELKDKLKKTQFLRADRRSIHSPKYSESEVDKVLTTYFEKNTYITRLTFSRLFNFTTSTARNRLIRLVEAGKLTKKGASQSPFYEPAEGYYSGVKDAESV